MHGPGEGEDGGVGDDQVGFLFPLQFNGFLAEEQGKVAGAGL